MSEPKAIAGELSGYRSLVDGSLRLTIDLTEFQAQSFHELFPTLHCLVAIAPLLPKINTETTG